jgi:hypothetical protein
MPRTILIVVVVSGCQPLSSALERTEAFTTDTPLHSAEKVFDAYLIVFGPRGQSATHACVPAAVVEAALREAAEPAVMVVADHEDGVSHAEFLVWLSQDRAFVRVDTHRDWNALDPDGISIPSESLVRFIDENESQFDAPLDRTLSRDRARAALAYWLETGEHLPALTWE